MEWVMACAAGKYRRTKSKQDGRIDTYGMDAVNGLKNDVVGAAGEIAMAKVLRLRDFVPAIDTFHKPDVGGMYIRTAIGHGMRLIVRTNDDPAAPYVLVTCEVETREFKIWGWNYGFEAQRREFWHTYNDNRAPAWFSGRSILHAMEDMPKKFIPKDSPFSRTRRNGHKPEHSIQLPLFDM
jgi:hypothetical protein